MRVKAAIAGAALAALAVGTAADASVIVVTDNGVIVTATQVTGPGEAAFTGVGNAAMNADGTWSGWVINFRIDGFQINALDLETQIGDVEHGIFGPLHQRWPASEEDGNYDTPTPTSTAAAPTTVDSAMMTGRALEGVVLNPAEDNSFSGSPITSTMTQGYGVGSFMKATWPFENTDSIDGAYVVVQGFSDPVTIRGIAAGPGAERLFEVVIPEPATAGLLAPLALGLLARRRRNA